MNLLSSIKNWGESVEDLRLSTSGFDSSPSEYFVPWGDLAVEPPLGTEPGGNPVAYAFLGLNQNDFDLGQCGILLYDQTIGSVAHHWLLTCDKAGYAYLLAQGNLCGGSNGCYPGASGGDPGLKDKDPGNAFHSALNVTQCADQGADSACHRITTLAFCPDCSPNIVALWPNQEALTTLQVSDNTAQSGSGTLSANTSQCPTVCLSVGNQVIVGDQLVISGQPTQTVTSINSDSTQLTASPGINGTISATPTWSYNGYLIKPTHDTNPPGGNVQYPGGVVQITSNAGSNTVIWALVSLGSFPYYATLLAYDTNLNTLWCAQSNSSTRCATYTTFTLSTFAVPTIVNGYVYVPTTSIGINGSSGVLRFSGH